MILYPAIDLKDGKCVRLTRGEFAYAKVYSGAPEQVARLWEAAGASYLHVVDLDGALDGRLVNREAIQSILASVHIPVQTGGGIRSIRDIEERLELGVARVILGTGAVNNPEMVNQAVREFGSERIVVGIDAKDGKAAISGWRTVSEESAVELALRMKDCGVSRIVYTDISRDGMLSGPNFSAIDFLARQTGMEIIASGGVSGLSDLLRLSELPVEGAIIGKALYENKLDLKEALKAVKQCSTNARTAGNKDEENNHGI